MNIVNLTPHPVTLIRPDGTRREFPACAPVDLPRALESPWTGGLDLIHDDTQGAYVTAYSYADTGLVDNTGYTGIENLPAISVGAVTNGVQTAYIVSIVTVIGALAAGRPTCDLLVPMGQVRDSSGRVIGATSLGAADVLLDPMARVLDEFLVASVLLRAQGQIDGAVVLALLLDDAQAFGVGDEEDRKDARYQHDAIDLLKRLRCEG